MEKTTFIQAQVEAARARCIGSRARALFNAQTAAESAAKEWDFNNSPEQVARAALVQQLVARGGKAWENKRVYFNSISVGDVGRTFDCYVDLSTGAVHGALTEEERTAAAAVIGL